MRPHDVLLLPYRDELHVGMRFAHCHGVIKRYEARRVDLHSISVPRARLRLGQTDRTDRWMAKYDRGHDVVIQAAFRLPAKEPIAQAAARCNGNRSEWYAAGDIAERIDACGICRLVVVGGDKSLGTPMHPCALQRQLLDVGHASDGPDHAVERS